MQQLTTRARVTQAALVAHLVVEACAKGQSPYWSDFVIVYRHRADGGSKVEELCVVLALDAAACVEGRAVERIPDVGPCALLRAVHAEGEASVGLQIFADVLIALGVEGQHVALPAVLHTVVVARAMAQVEMGVAAVQLMGIVNRQASSVVGQSPQLESVAVAVLAVLRREPLRNKTGQKDQTYQIN